MSNYNSYVLTKDGKPTTDLKLGDLYISVSSILKQEGKDLIKWALRTFGPDENPLKAYDSYMSKVSDLGSRLHRYVECTLKKTPLLDHEITEDMIPAIESWERFLKESKLEMIASERILCSPKWRCAGTCDLVIRYKGKLFVADIKTGGVYASAFTQMAAYKAMLCQEPKKRKIPGIEGADLMVINLHRDGKPVELHTLDSFYKGRVSINDELGVFHCLRFIWFHRNAKSRQFESTIKNMREVFSPLEQRFKEAFKL